MALAGLGSPTTPSTVAPNLRRMSSPYSRRARACSQSSSPAPCRGTYTPPPALPTPVPARSPASSDRGVAGTSRVNRQSSSLAIRSLTKSETSTGQCLVGDQQQTHHDGPPLSGVFSSCCRSFIPTACSLDGFERGLAGLADEQRSGGKRSNGRTCSRPDVSASWFVTLLGRAEVIGALDSGPRYDDAGVPVPEARTACADVSAPCSRNRIASVLATVTSPALSGPPTGRVRTPRTGSVPLARLGPVGCGGHAA
jgi:hypothetical protein